MINYNININNGIQAFDAEGKTITVSEATQTVDTQVLAREIHHENMLIPEQVAEAVLQNFATAALNLMRQGFAIQFKSGNDVIMRIYPDVNVNGGNINLRRAKELIPGTTEITADNAAELVSQAGITVRPRVKCTRRFWELLHSEDCDVQRKDIVEKAQVLRSHP